MKIALCSLLLWCLIITTAMGIDIQDFKRLNRSQQLNVVRATVKQRLDSTNLLQFKFNTQRKSLAFENLLPSEPQSEGSLFNRLEGSITVIDRSYLVTIDSYGGNGEKWFESRSQRNANSGVVRSLNTNSNGRDAGIINNAPENYMTDVRIGSWIGIQKGQEGNSFEVNWFSSLDARLDDASISCIEDSSTVQVTVKGMTYGQMEVEREYHLDASRGMRLYKVRSILRSGGELQAINILEVENWADIDGVWWPTSFKEYGNGWPDKTKGTMTETECVVSKVAIGTSLEIDFPSGLEVYDTIRGVRYIQGESKELPLFGSVGDRVLMERASKATGDIKEINLELVDRLDVDPVVGPKNQLGRQSLLIIGGLLLTISIVRFGWIRYRNR